MTVDRFKDWLTSQLGERGVDVSRYDVEPGLSDVAIRGDNVEYRLRIVSTSPPGGELTDDVEPPTRPAGTEIEIRRR